MRSLTIDEVLSVSGGDSEVTGDDRTRMSAPVARNKNFGNDDSASIFGDFIDGGPFAWPTIASDQDTGTVGNLFGGFTTDTANFPDQQQDDQSPSSSLDPGIVALQSKSRAGTTYYTP